MLVDLLEYNMKIFYGLILSAYGSKDAKIIGGNAVQPHSEPHILSLQRERSHYCAGSLISATHGVTAAHCNMSYVYFYDVFPYIKINS